jgi:hypothetical protein
LHHTGDAHDHAHPATLSRLLLLLLALSMLALSACGGSDEDSDEDEVRSITRLVIANDAAACDSMTERLLDGTTGSLRKCKEAARQSEPRTGVHVKSVAVRGDTATANYASRTSAISQLRLVKQDGDWKVDGVRTLPNEDAFKPKIRTGLSARETVDAYYRAIRNEDGAALCGLLTERYATKILGEGKRPDPIADCVQALQEYDWADVRKRNAGVRAVKVTQAGDSATVSLSNGKRVLLQRKEGRWAIDDIRR